MNMHACMLSRGEGGALKRLLHCVEYIYIPNSFFLLSAGQHLPAPVFNQLLPAVTGRRKGEV